VSVFHQQSQAFEFKPGPIFAHIVLADEINRTTPKTQKQPAGGHERRSGVGGQPDLSAAHPFMVIATQNPWEHHGTFPLPESQLDRFLMRIRIGIRTWRMRRRCWTVPRRFIRPTSWTRAHAPGGP